MWIKPPSIVAVSPLSPITNKRNKKRPVPVHGKNPSTGPHRSCFSFASSSSASPLSFDASLLSFGASLLSFDASFEPALSVTVTLSTSLSVPLSGRHHHTAEYKWCTKNDMIMWGFDVQLTRCSTQTLKGASAINYLALICLGFGVKHQQKCGSSNSVGMPRNSRLLCTILQPVQHKKHCLNNANKHHLTITPETYHTSENKLPAGIKSIVHVIINTPHRSINAY